MPGAWGYEALIDVGGCDRAVSDDPAAIGVWVRDLVDVIQMQAHGAPLIEHFGAGDLGGWTVLQLIETSDISAHFNDIDASAYISVHSCNPFVLDTVIRQLQRTLRPETIHATLFSRKAGMHVRELARLSVRGEPAAV